MGLIKTYTKVKSKLQERKIKSLEKGIERQEDRDKLFAPLKKRDEKIRELQSKKRPLISKDRKRKISDRLDDVSRSITRSPTLNKIATNVERKRPKANKDVFESGLFSRSGKAKDNPYKIV